MAGRSFLFLRRFLDVTLLEALNADEAFLFLRVGEGVAPPPPLAPKIPPPPGMANGPRGPAVRPAACSKRGKFFLEFSKKRLQFLAIYGNI